MLRRFGFSLVVGGLLIGLLILTPMAGAQVRGRGRDRNARQQPGGPPVELTGTVAGVRGNLIQMTTDSNQTWLLQVEPKAKVSVAGMAKADFLRPGLFVAFSAEVDKRRSVVEEEITKLTVFTPSQVRPLGAFPSQDGFGGLQGQIPDEPGKAEQRGQGPVVESFDLAGRFMGVNRKGQATVIVPNRYFKPALTVKIAEGVEIDLDLADPQAIALARKGDKIEVKGKQVAPTAAIANEVKITLTEPVTLAQPEKKSARQPTRTRRGDADDADEDADDKEPDDEDGAAKGRKTQREDDAEAPADEAGASGEEGEN